MHVHMRAGPDCNCLSHLWVSSPSVFCLGYRRLETRQGHGTGKSPEERWVERAVQRHNRNRHFVGETKQRRKQHREDRGWGCKILDTLLCPGPQLSQKPHSYLGHCTLRLWEPHSRRPVRLEGSWRGVRTGALDQVLWEGRGVWLAEGRGMGFGDIIDLSEFIWESFSIQFMQTKFIIGT